MTRNCHVPFCRAVGEATLLLTLIILKKELSTVGHTETNTLGERLPAVLGLVGKMYSKIHSS
jgi:hypothetical protein